MEEMEGKNNEIERLQVENNRLHQQLRDCNGELNSIRADRNNLEGQLSNANNVKEEVLKNLRKFKILLKSEQNERAEAEECKARREALLEEQTAHRLLGSGINIQGACATLPEIEASIRQTLTVVVSEWVEEESQALHEFSKNWEWFIPEVFAMLFTLCKQRIDATRQHYVNMFLGKVEGAVEDDMDAATAHFMRNHLRRHHLTLFSVTSGAGGKMCRRIIIHLAGMIVDNLDGEVDYDRVTRALVSSGLEEIASRYVKILANCAVLHPLVSQASDCSQVQLFNKNLHSEPIDGDGDVTTGRKCMVIFPALSVKREGSGQGWDPVSKRFVLGPQKQT